MRYNPTKANHSAKPTSARNVDYGHFFLAIAEFATRSPFQLLYVVVSPRINKRIYVDLLRGVVSQVSVGVLHITTIKYVRPPIWLVGCVVWVDSLGI
jgi:hypothetical protein